MATNRTTVNISITPELDAFLQSRVRTGRYQTTSEVVREALRLLERHEQDREEAPKGQNILFPGPTPSRGGPGGEHRLG